MPILLASVSVVCAQAEQTWTEVRSPHFRVLTNGSASDARKVANEFEQMRHVFAVRFHSENLESSAPLTIIAATDEGALKSLEPRAWKATHGMVAGEFIEGWEREYATVRLDTWGDDNAIVAYHEYTHSVIHRLFHWMPLWLDEGIAEFYGATWFRSDKILIGAPSERTVRLKSRGLYPVETMLNPEKLQLYSNPETTNFYYAEAWGLVHYMTFGKGMENGAKLNTFLRKVDSGETELQAFREAFGDLAAFDSGFETYVSQQAFVAASMPPDVSLKPSSFSARKLSPAETAYEIGAFNLRSGEEELARASLQKAIALDPNLADAYEELAYLDFKQGDDAKAQEGWQKALQLNPDQWRSLFAQTMLNAKPNILNLSDERQRETFIALHKINALAPRYAPAYVEEAILEWKIGYLQKALTDSQHAETLEPWRAGYHLLTADILLQGRQPKIAAEHARYVANHWKSTDHNEAVDLLRQVPQADRGPDPIPAYDTPPNTKSAFGEIQTVVCSNDKKRHATLTFLADDAKDGKPMELKSEGYFGAGFSDTLWWGEDHFDACHHLEGLKALIAYDSDKHIVLEVDVRDTLPPVSPPPATK